MPTVLVIDGSTDLCAFFTLLLYAEGYRVVTAASLGQARVELAMRRPDLVISEVRLADAPPFAVVELLATTAKTCDLPVVLCTGAVREVERAAADLTHRGVTAVLKPFDIDDVVAAVQRGCSRPAPPSQAAACASGAEESRA